MVKNISVENQSNKIFAFLLGLSVSEGISSVFSFGSTLFTLSEVLSPVLFVLLCIKDGRGIADFIRRVPIGFKIFFVVVVCSIIPGLIYFMSVDVIYRYFVGIIYLLIILTTAVDAFILRKSRDAIIKGLYIGLVVNVLYTVLCYAAFQSRTIITLSAVFSRAGFYVPRASFRSQGLFLEPSHFVRYVGTIGLVVISSIKIKKSFFRFIIVVASIAMLMFSYSGSLIILTVGLIIYWIGTRNPKNIGRVKPRTLALIYVVCLLVILGISGFSINDYVDVEGTIHRIMNSADITDVGNSERFESMQTIMDNLGFVMMGCGWNLTGTFIQTENLGITAAFSDILELLLETGVIGLLLYVCSLLALNVGLWRMRDRYSRALSTTLLVILALQIGTDYALNTCIMLIFGLSVGQMADRRLT